MLKKIGLISLGCRLNSYESDSIITKLIEEGYEIDNQDADIYIINSCVITERSVAKTRNVINRCLKKDAKLIITGCMAKTIEQKDNIIFIPNDFKSKIPEIIKKIDNIIEKNNIEPSRFDYHAPYLTPNTRVNIKIQDGCDNFCSYCILPFVRGSKVLSRPLKDIENEVKILLDKGFKEIVITGLNITKYNYDFYNLNDLLDTLLKINHNFRLHLSSIEPIFINERFIETLMHPKMVRHLHLSLQSASNKILQLMNRKYRIEKVIDAVEKIRDKDRLFNFTADIISGFPGETDEDHKENCKIIDKIGLYHTHIFRYSDRPNTKASTMDNKVNEKIKKIRSNELEKIAKESKIKVLKKFEFKISTVLVEKNDKDSYGLNEYYIPVHISKKLIQNNLYKVKTYFHNNILCGELIDDNTK